MRKKSIPFLFLVLSIIIISLNYYLSYKGMILYFLFWLGLLSVLFSVIYILIKHSNEKKFILTYLFFFGLVLYLTYYLRSPHYMFFQDEMIHWQTASLILESGNLNATHTIRPLGQWYPGLSITTAILTNICGLSLLEAGRAIVSIVHSFVLIFLFIFFYSLSKNLMIAGLSALLYACNPEYIFFDSVFSYESLAIGLFTLLLLVLSMKKEKESIPISLLLIIITFSLVITHHVTSFMFLLFIGIIIMITLFLHIPQDKHRNIFVIGSIFVLGWLVYTATGAVQYLHGVLSARVKSLLEVILYETGKREFFRITQLPYYETFIDIFLYPPIILLLAAGGLYIFFKSKREKDYLDYTLIAWCMIYFATWPFILSGGSELAYRSWTTLFIGVAFLISIALIKLYQKKKWFYKVVAGLALLIVFMGGISLGSNEERRYSITICASGEGALTLDVKRASKWYNNQFGAYNQLVGDKTVKYMFGQYGRQYVETYNAWRIFYPKKVDKKLLAEINNYDALVIDERISHLLARGESYFTQGKLDIPGYPRYGYESSLPKNCLEKFETVNTFIRVYDNGNIDIFENIKRYI